MAAKLTKINEKIIASNYREYLCDTDADIALLPKDGIKGTLATNTSDILGNDPCSIGSMAYVCDSKKFYILSPNNEWVVYSE